MRRTYIIIRNFLFSWLNKEFLVFLFFLLLSGIFWLLMTLNETYEKEYYVAVSLSNVPKNIVLTSNEYDTIKVTLRDKGLQHMGYMYADRLRPITFNFKAHARSGGRGVIQLADIQKAIYQQLPASTRITATKPEKVEFYYNYGQHKRVPVTWVGNVVPEARYFISRVICHPESVDVYAIQQQLDSIKVVYTEPLNYVDFTDTLKLNAAIVAVQGMKTIPARVTMKFCSDVLTEERIEEIPIRGVNVQEGKVLRTFPAKVDVRFVAGVSIVKQLTKDQFSVMVDYNEIKNQPAEKCKRHLTRGPEGVSRPQLSIKEVDYLIEEE